MPSWLTQLLDVKTLVGLLIGALGAWFAIWLQARFEHGHWLRQQRLEALTAFLGGLDALARPATNWRLSWNEPAEAAAREAFFDRVEDLERGSGRIFLLASTDVNRAAIKVLRQWSHELNSALKSHDEVRYQHGWEIATKLYREFVKVARKELGQTDPFIGDDDKILSE